MMDPMLSFLLLGGVLIAIELIVLQAVVGWVFLAGVSALITAMVLWFMPLGWLGSVGLFLMVQLLLLATLLKPIRSWQQRTKSMPDQDLIGQTGVVIATIGRHESGKVRWSGTDWDALIDDSESADTLTVDQTISIVKVEGITLYVKKTSSDSSAY